jgi:cell division protease FtsH
MKNSLISRWTREGILEFPWGKFETLEKLVLNAGLLEKLNRRIELFLKNRDEFHKLQLPWRYGIFLFGPSGSGKTSAGKAIAQKLGWHHFTIPAHEILDSHFFERALAEVVKGSERVIVLEDVDLMIRTMEPHVFFSLLDHAMETAEGFFWIANSRHAEETPKTQLLRPGRFDEAIRLESPNSSLRAQLIRELLLKDGVDELEENTLSEWVENTQGLSFSHFEELRQIKVRMILEDQDRSETNAILNSYIQDQVIAGDRWGGLSDSTEDLKERVRHIDPRVLMAALDMSDVFRRLIEKVIGDSAINAGASKNGSDSDLKTGP